MDKQSYSMYLLQLMEEEMDSDESTIDEARGYSAIFSENKLYIGS